MAVLDLRTETCGQYSREEAVCAICGHLGRGIAVPFTLWAGHSERLPRMGLQRCAACVTWVCDRCRGRAGWSWWNGWGASVCVACGRRFGPGSVLVAETAAGEAARLTAAGAGRGVVQPTTWRLIALVTLVVSVALAYLTWAYVGRGEGYTVRNMLAGALVGALAPWVLWSLWMLLVGPRRPRARKPTRPPAPTEAKATPASAAPQEGPSALVSPGMLPTAGHAVESPQGNPEGLAAPPPLRAPSPLTSSATPPPVTPGVAATSAVLGQPSAAAGCVAPPPKPPSSGLAVASLLLGAVGFLTCGCTSLIGLALGIASLVRISRSEGHVRGRAAAVAGTLLSALGCLVMAPFAVTMLRYAWMRETQLACVSNVLQLCTAVRMYSDDYDETYPPSAHWSYLLFPDYLNTDRIFHCPSADDGGSPSYAFNAALDGVSVISVSAPTDTVMLFDAQPGYTNLSGGPERLALRHNRGAVVGFADRHAARLARDALDEVVWDPFLEGDTLPVHALPGWGEDAPGAEQDESPPAEAQKGWPGG